MKRLTVIASLFVIFFLAHHLMVYIHEWTHATCAWIAGYKSSPFDIHYGTRWFTLWDIDENVDYRKIYSDGKSYLVACIAIAPILLQMILFPVGLKLLRSAKVQKKRWLFAFVCFFTLFLLAEIYAYIPIRTFSSVDDIFNFVTATGLSPWVVAVPGTLYVIWGLYQLLSKGVPQAYTSLKITTKLGRFVFKLVILYVFFAYFGGVGFTKPDKISHVLSGISSVIFLLGVVVIGIQAMRKHQKR